MTLLDAPSYNARRARLIRNSIIGGLIAIVVIAAATWFLWDWPEQHRVNNFFSAIEAKDFNKAYGIWNKLYNMEQFQKDWGPASDYGVIRSHQIEITKTVGNGVVMGVNINGGKTPIFLRVDHKTKQIGFSPIELYMGP
jgi:hypothetical protein